MAKQVTLFESFTQIGVKARISKATAVDLPERVRPVELGTTWYFMWKQLYEDYPKHEFYKIAVDNEIQGLIRVSHDPANFTILENIEVAPFNFGENAKYQNVAGSLLAFAVDRSFDIQTRNPGYLVFNPLNEKVAEVYASKYGAKRLDDSILMIIAPRAGKKLIDQYLNL